MLELAMAGSVTIQGEDVVVLNSRAEGDAVMQGVLDHLNEEPGPLAVKVALRRLACGHGARLDAVLHGLVDKGILREEHHRFLWVIPFERFPTEDPGPEHELAARVRSALATQSAPDPRTRALVALIAASGLTQHFAERSERRAAAAHAEELAQSDPITAAVYDAAVAAIADDQSAAAAAATMGAVV
jgi:hypothetical protein